MDEKWGGEHETRWCFGYRCEIGEHEHGFGWYGRVNVPMWHPVRSVGFDDLLVLMLFRGEWLINIDGDMSRVEVLDAVQSVAARLRAMQMGWDQLSPYEREYRI